MNFELKYTIVFCDIDDTLINDNGLLSALNKNEIQNFINLGGNFILATGRNFTAAKNIYNKLQLKTPIIINQGCVFDPLTNSFLLRNTLDLNQAISLCKYLEEFNIYFQIFSEEDIYVKYKTDYSYTFIKNCNVSIKETVINLSDYFVINNFPIDKIMIETDPAIIDNLVKALKINFFDLSIEKSKNWIIEIANSNNTKGVAVKKLLDMYNIDKKFSMAIGDSFSDLSMFHNVGFSVAVDNSPEQVKLLASASTYSNNYSGVALALTNYAYKHK